MTLHYNTVRRLRQGAVGEALGHGIPRRAHTRTCHPGGFSIALSRSIWLFLFVLAAGYTSSLAVSPGASHGNSSDFGVILMAHGGSPEWNEGVLAAVEPLRDQYTIEVAFGMADAVTIQEAVQRLEAWGVRRIGVVRLFISGESWYDRTEQILGLRPGAPERPVPSHLHEAAHGSHRMEFWRVQTEASFALSTQGLAEAQAMGAVLADRARALSRDPQSEDVLILAHGPGDDLENERWIANIRARATAVRDSLPFRRIQVETLREDWPEKRQEAEQRVRAFVERARNEEGTAIVIPFRVQGFGPYAKVLDGLHYVSDGQGLIPHSNVTQWIAEQIRTLRMGPFRSVVN